MTNMNAAAIAGLGLLVLGCRSAPAAQSNSGEPAPADTAMTAAPQSDSAVEPRPAGRSSTPFSQQPMAAAAAGSDSGDQTSVGGNSAPAGAISSAGRSASAAGNTAAAAMSDAGVDMTIEIQPAPSNISRWEEPGKFAAMVEANAGPGRAYTIFRPRSLGQDGLKHPIVTWGNGTGTTPSSYNQLLTHYATHGLVVVASNATNTGSGEEMIAGVHWLLQQHATADSPYFEKLDVGAIATVGYSQGGIGAVIAATDPRITTSIPIAGGDATITQIHGPTFLIGFASDAVVPPLWNMAPQFESTPVAAVYGVLKGGATHLEALGDGGRMRGYTTAWLVLQLLHDNAVSGVFYGPECTLCKDALWITERKGVPGVEPPPQPTKDECLANPDFPATATPECKDCLCSSCPREAVQCTDVCWDLAECTVNQCSSNTDKDVALFSCIGTTANGPCGAYADGIRFTSALSVHVAGCMAPGTCLDLCIP